MNPLRIITALLCIAFCCHAVAQEKDIDSALSGLADNLAVQLKDKEKKKVAVVDFTDLQGSTQGELGKYIAEELTVDLVMLKRDFSVLDRANLSRILAEHKLTSQGLVDPENAKKIGQFAGVDAFIFGTIVPKESNIVSLSVKIITTDTAEVTGVARAAFKTDNNVQKLISKPNSSEQGGASGILQNDKAKVVKLFGDLRVEVQSLKVVNGGEFLLSLNLVNQNTNKSIFVAANANTMNTPNAVIRNESGTEFYSGPYDRGVSGIPSIMYSQYGYNGPGFSKATEIRPLDSIPAAIKFASRMNKAAAPGPCTVQLELIVSYDFENGFGHGKVNTLAAKIAAE